MPPVERTPDKTSAEKGKRGLSDSAPMDQDEKRQRDEDDDVAAPAWAKKLFEQTFAPVLKKLTNLEASVAIMNEKLSGLAVVEERMDDLETYVSKNSDDISEIRANIAALWAENGNLRKALDEKASVADVAKCTDTTLRNTMTICGVAKNGSEKHWDHTKKALADALAKLTPDVAKNTAFWYRKIERAHRGKQVQGKIPVIYVKFKSWVEFDYLNNLFKGENVVENPDNLEIYEMFHPHTSERRKQAVNHRSEIRKKDKKIKAYVKYPAKLMVKKPGEKVYSCVATY